MKKNKLWTKDFTCITLATILSSIGGEALNLPISMLVFEKTKSTMASAFIFICGMLPDILFQILIAPVIDRGQKKKWIVRMDLLLAALYLGMGVLVQNQSFQYITYVFFSLAVGFISVLYRLAFNAWYPDLIPKGAEQQGYAVSGAIYPTIIIVMAPITTYLYAHIAIYHMFYLVVLLTVCSVVIESCITEKKEKTQEEKYSLKQYGIDLKEGFHFIRRDKGIRNIYTYMSITCGSGEGVNLLTQAYFQTHPLLTVSSYGFLKSAEMLGRMLSSVLWYHTSIPEKKRYQFTKFSYTFYQCMDTILLYLPLPGMMLNRFLCGGIGCGSATIREAAVKSYLPANIRARVSAFFDVVIAIGTIAFQLIAGALGKIMPYRWAAVIISLFTLLSMFVLIVIPKEVNRKVYEATRE